MEIGQNIHSKNYVYTISLRPVNALQVQYLNKKPVVEGEPEVLQHLLEMEGLNVEIGLEIIYFEGRSAKFTLNNVPCELEYNLSDFSLEDLQKLAIFSCNNNKYSSSNKNDQNESDNSEYKGSENDEY
ncbi:hypothetical protein C1645_817042 [Glomus cerebriforme]|uniref:Uncharacterized protein n=1 Tax=Glomus cerebriforme TaxID=658196 RepID=A0A397TFQ0_9GLOM|nr:hypothetical protein C1645_817042 [Glomus cerebriforme]